MRFEMLAPPRASRLGALIPLTLITAALAAAAVPSAAHAARDIPIGVGVYNLNGARSQDGPNRIWAMRFVLDRDTRIERLFTGFNMEGVYTDPFGRPAPVELRTKMLNKGSGSPPPPSDLPSGWTTGTGRIDYGHGNGGRLRARLVPMKADGTPDLGSVLAEDTFYPVERYKETKAEFAISDRAGLVYSRFGGVALQGGTPYWVVYQNVDPNPRMNYISYNSPVVKDSESGPNGRNNLDPNMPGAILGLDPREVVGWTWTAVRRGITAARSAAAVPRSRATTSARPPRTTARGCPGTPGRSPAAPGCAPTSRTCRIPMAPARAATRSGS